MKFKDFLLLEKRRNWQHPAQQTPRGILNTYKSLVNSGENKKNLFVTFVNIDLYKKGNITSNLPGKVGFNPSTEYNTPIGLYAYPIKKSIEYYGTRDLNWGNGRITKIINFPFAFESKYWAIFKIKDGYKVFTPKSPDIMYIEAIKKLFQNKKVKQFFNNNPEVKTKVFDLLNRGIDTLALSIWMYKAGDNKYAILLWSLSRILAYCIKYNMKHLSFYDFRSYTTISGDNSHISLWTKLLIESGVDVFSDEPDRPDGSVAIIHSNEPVQTVVLNPKCVEVITTAPNTEIKSSDEIRKSTVGEHYKKFSGFALKLIKLGFEFKSKSEESILLVNKKYNISIEFLENYFVINSIKSKTSDNIKFDINIVIDPTDKIVDVIKNVINAVKAAIEVKQKNKNNNVMVEGEYDYISDGIVNRVYISSISNYNQVVYSNIIKI